MSLRKSAKLIATLVLGVSCIAAADTLTFTSSVSGPASLLTNTTGTNATTFVENFLNFASSNFGTDNEATLNVHAVDPAGLINGVTFTIFGNFSGLGSAQFNINSGAGSGTFSTAFITGFIAFAPSTNVNLVAVLDLDDAGDSAAITQVRYQFSTQPVPEPSVIVLLAIGLGATLLKKRTLGC